MKTKNKESSDEMKQCEDDILNQVDEIAKVEGMTPLMGAARLGKVAEVQELLAAAADPTLRNRQGLTALELTRACFGGTAPPLLARLLQV